jgi:hypothetical protein
MGRQAHAEWHVTLVPRNPSFFVLVNPVNPVETRSNREDVFKRDEQDSHDSFRWPVWMPFGGRVIDLPRGRRGWVKLSRGLVVVGAPQTNSLRYIRTTFA